MASKSPTDPDTEAVVESEGTTPHIATNLDQAMKYIQALETTMENVEANAKIKQPVTLWGRPLKR